MAHILHLDASPRGDLSISRTLTTEFITDWQAAHPGDTVTYRDLGHSPVPFITEDWIAAAYCPPVGIASPLENRHTPAQSQAIQLSDELVDEFLAADRYVFGIPMYNFTIPANFKAYLDQIVRVGRTFSIDATGFKGLVHDKKMTIINASGGAYADGSPSHSFDLQTPYLQLVFGFIGSVDVEFIHADSLSLGDEARDKAITTAQSAMKAAIHA